MNAVASVTLAFLVLSANAYGQSTEATPDAAKAAVRPGEKVLVTTVEGAIVSGRVRTLRDASLTIDTRGGVETLPARRVARIVVKDSLRNGIMIGAIAGGAAGLAGGLLVNAICVSESGGCPAYVIGLASLGAGAGAAIGAGLDGLRHRTVFDTIPGAPGEYSPELLVTMGFGRSSAGGAAAGGPATAGVAWAMRHTSGFGVEFDSSRTIGRSVRPPAEGVKDTTTASAKVQYYFARPPSRLQPYVSGGAAMYEESSFSTITVWPFHEEQPFDIRGLTRKRGVAIAAGGGARVQIGRRMSIRPDVTLYKGDGWTHVRGSVDVGVGW